MTVVADPSTGITKLAMNTKIEARNSFMMVPPFTYKLHDQLHKTFMFLRIPYSHTSRAAYWSPDEP